MSTILQREIPYTAVDLAGAPDDGRRFELIGGELIVTPSPSEKHQWIVAELGSQLRNYLHQNQLGAMYYAPFDVWFDEYDVVQPDIVALSRDKLARIGANRITGAPDLVVEIISPSTRGIDRVRKAALYATHGVAEYWIVDPDQETVVIQGLREGLYVTVEQPHGKAGSSVFPGFKVDVAALFERPEWMTTEPE